MLDAPSYRLKPGSLRDLPMSALGHKQTFAVHQPMSALPPIAAKIADIVGFRWGQGTSVLPPRGSDIDLLSNGERIIHIDPEIPDGALYLGVTE